eukprot:8348511-Karenia_brevis.AAC.1
MVPESKVLASFHYTRDVFAPMPSNASSQLKLRMSSTRAKLLWNWAPMATAEMMVEQRALREDPATQC